MDLDLEALQKRVAELEQALIEREQGLAKANEELRLWVQELEGNIRDMTLLNGMNDFLQGCLTIEEVYAIARQFATRLFEGQSGALYILNNVRALAESVVEWGDFPPDERRFQINECWALRGERVHIVEDSDAGLQCQHVQEGVAAYICVPLVTQRRMLGMLHVRCTQAISPQVRDHWKWLAMMVADSIAMTLVNVQLREQLHYQSVHDPLTGLFNRRYLDEVLEREMHKATRQQRTVSIILIDIDHFKQINDVYGHDVGDALLSAVGHLLHSSVRDEDFACRYGGEEFLLILSETSLETALKRAEYLREAVKQVRIEDMRVAAISITFSIGVAGFPDHGSTGAQVIRAADRALRQAKADGRDRVVVADIFSEEAGK